MVASEQGASPGRSKSDKCTSPTGIARRWFVALSVAVLAALLTAGGAIAQTPPPTLTGEFLYTDGLSGSGTQHCDTENMHLTFSVSGIAVGPYPGTFTESGSATLTPYPTGTGAFSATSFEASFTIQSGSTTITGEKHLLPTIRNLIVCTEDDPPFGETTSLAVQTTYEATITTETGTYRDEGTTYVDYGSYEANGEDLVGFAETFTSALLTPIPVDDPDAATVVLTPPTDINPVGTQHTVTATAATATGGFAEDVTIRFTVMGASDVQGSCTTNAQGQCTFTYTGPQLPGADLITGCADNDDSGTIEAEEPCGEATKIWVIPATTPGQVTGGGWILNAGDKVSFGFNAKSDDKGVKGNCNVIDHGTKTHIKCQTVDSLVVAGTHATFFGQATVDGVATDYRIDVDDLGEPGTADTFRIQTDSGYSAGGTLAGGNIQIHR